MNRAERERLAYDSTDIWEVSDRWHARFPHVFASPNTMRHERLFERLIHQKIAGARVLEIGCGDGDNARKMSALGAKYVYGIDVSEKFLERARSLHAPGDGHTEFANADASRSVDGTFDLIVGRSILHHIDYRPAVRRLSDDNLERGGLMIFMEPLGANPLIRLYTAVVRHAHTPDERSFRAEDLRWFRAEFPTFELHPFNLMTLYAGLVSSKILPEPDNALLRAADSIDSWIARRTRRLDAHFRHALFVMRKL